MYWIICIVGIFNIDISPVIFNPTREADVYITDKPSPRKCFALCARCIPSPRGIRAYPKRIKLELMEMSFPLDMIFETKLAASISTIGMSIAPANMIVHAIVKLVMPVVFSNLAQSALLSWSDWPSPDYDSYRLTFPVQVC